MLKYYWNHYFSPIKVNGLFEIIFRSALLSFFIMGMAILILLCFGITIRDIC